MTIIWPIHAMKYLNMVIFVEKIIAITLANLSATLLNEVPL